MDLSNATVSILARIRLGITRYRAITAMEKEVGELSRRIDNHERRIKKLESSIQPKEKKKRIKGINEIKDVVETFKSLDLSEYSYIYELSGLSLYLAILHIAKEKLSIDGLAPPEMSNICRDKIRISAGVNRSTISNTLSRAGAKVDRVDNPRGKGFVYRIMRAGEQFLQGSIKKSKTTE